LLHDDDDDDDDDVGLLSARNGNLEVSENLLKGKRG
jgi:hypothetical protein